MNARSQLIGVIVSGWDNWLMSWCSWQLAGQEIPLLTWNLNYHCHAHKSQPLDAILSHLNPVHPLTLYWPRYILILFS